MGDHKDCKNVDMNMICGQSGTSSVGSRSCQCRDDMKWNDEGLECQIYIDVNCTDIKTVESPEPVETLVLETPNNTLASDKLEEEEFEFDEQEFSNLTDSKGNLNISEISADETLSSSELSKLNPNETSPEEIRGAFCRDVARVSRSYEQTLVPPRQNHDNYNNYGRRGGSFGIVGLVIIIMIACCACGLVWKFLEKIKEACCGNSRNKRQDYDMASRGSSDHQQPVYNHPGTQFPPQQDQAYPPQPDNTLYPQIQPDMPPLGPAIPPTQPGYPNNPDPYANNPTPYPPVTGAAPMGGLPYPVAGPTGGAPPPYPAGESFPPYPPATGAAPPYPPAPGVAPFYPPVAGAALPYPPVPGAVPSYPPVPGAAPPYPPASNAPSYPTQPAYNPAA